MSDSPLDYRPAITHPEHFYGFVGVAIAWQLTFIVIAREWVRYRLIMLRAIVEKLSFAVAVGVLFAMRRVAPAVVVFGASERHP